MPPAPRAHVGQVKVYDQPLDVSSSSVTRGDANGPELCTGATPTTARVLHRTASAPVNSTSAAAAAAAAAGGQSLAGSASNADGTTAAGGYGAGGRYSAYGGGAYGTGAGAAGGYNSTYGGSSMYGSSSMYGGSGMYGGGGYGSMYGGGYGGYGGYGGGYSRMGMYGSGGYGMGMGMDGMGPQFSWLHSVQHFTSSMGYLTELLGMNTQAIGFFVGNLMSFIETAGMALASLQPWREFPPGHPRHGEPPPTPEEERRRLSRVRVLRWAASLLIAWAGFKLLRLLRGPPRRRAITHQAAPARILAESAMENIFTRHAPSAPRAPAPMPSIDLADPWTL